MVDLIPAKFRYNKEMLDSVFLLNYARRIEGKARWTVVWHTLIGGAAGFGLGQAALMLKAFFEGLRGGMIALQHLLVQVQDPQPELWVWTYLPWMLACIFAVLGGAKGLDKGDEMRFRSQLALHVLDLRERMKV